MKRGFGVFLIGDTMAEIDLTQSEADALIAMEKHCIEERVWNFPSLGGSLNIPLVSSDRKENFFLDIGRGRINFNKGNYQNRGRNVVVLVRLDFGGSPHRNPDDTEIESPHIHIYKEGYGDKWAYQVPIAKFPDLNDLWKTLDNFMGFCNITKPPKIQGKLW